MENFAENHPIDILKENLKDARCNYKNIEKIPQYLDEALEKSILLKTMLDNLNDVNVNTSVINYINTCNHYLVQLNKIEADLDLTLPENKADLDSLELLISNMITAHKKAKTSLSSITEKVSKTDRAVHLIEGILRSLAVIMLVALSPILLIAELFSDNLPSLGNALIKHLKDACRDFKTVFTGKEQPEVLRTLEGHLKHFETSVRRAHEFIKAPVEDAVNENKARGNPYARN